MSILPEQSAAVAFDHNSAEYAASWRNIYADLRGGGCPVAWSESYGGFYVISGYADVARALKDDDTFSSYHDVAPDAPFGGIIIPPNPNIAVPIEMDPPDFTPLRKMLNPPFAPGQATRWEAFIRDVTTAMVDKVIESGNLDFVEDISSPVPAIFTAALLGLPLTDERIGQIFTLIVTGGDDTTTGLVANALAWLSEHPDQRDWLLEDLTRLIPACEEFLRYFTPVQGLARTVRKPVEIGGQSLEVGDRVWLSFAGANLDPEEFENPDEMILDRTPNRHQAFGWGLHRCLGSNFTRTEFRVMLEEVLTRMPDFSVDLATSARYQNIGIVNGWTNVHATFTPGARRGSDFTL